MLTGAYLHLGLVLFVVIVGFALNKLFALLKQCTAIQSAKTQNADKARSTLHTKIQALTSFTAHASCFQGEGWRREVKFKQKHYFLHTNPTGPNSATFILLDQV